MERGQASIEYIGAVALVALALSAAATVAAPDLPGALVHHLRVGLCIVGGDVCRSGDAERAGLEPCVVRSREADKRSRVSIATLSYGTGKAMTIERRSDGSARVAIASGDEGGVTVGVGLKLGGRTDAGGEFGGSVGFTTGYAWELPDERALARFLHGVKQSPGRIGWDLVQKGAVPPSERYREATASAAGEAAASILGLDQPLVSGAGRAAIGRRMRNGRTSWYFDATNAGAHLFPTAAGEGAWVAELSEHPRELRLTAHLPGETEIRARLDLSSEANARVARALLAGPSLARARALGRHIARHGTVERRRYRVRELPSDPDLAVKLGFAGVDHGGDARERTLVSAEVLRSSGVARRADCLGLDDRG